MKTQHTKEQLLGKVQSLTNGKDDRVKDNPSLALAEYTATTLGINTVGATASVYPEIIDKKETGKLKTDGTFKRYEPYKVTTTVTSTQKHSFLFWNWTTTEKKVTTETKVKVTDLGKTIDPATQTK